LIDRTGLKEAGYRVHLLNTAVVKQYEGLKYTDDDSDAFWLAHSLRLGILPTGCIYLSQTKQGGQGFITQTGAIGGNEPLIF